MTYYLSLGSNISPRHYYIDEACRLLNERCGTITRRSQDYFSMPVGYQSEHEYLNICVCLLSEMSPLDLLYATQQIERDLGRTHKSYSPLPLSSPLTEGVRGCHYSDRTIDIDLLQAFDQQGQEIFICTQTLTLPHSRMTERDFVTIPLAQLLSTPNR